jgi:ribosome-associated translation inhibitor RaiA
MRPAVTLTFHNIERSGALEARMHEIAERLRRHYDEITHCHITVEDRLDGGPDGASYAAKIHLSLPGAQIHSDGIDPGDQGHRDVYAALRAAYASAGRQLQDLKLDRGKSSLFDGARSLMCATGPAEHQRSKG